MTSSLIVTLVSIAQSFALFVFLVLALRLFGRRSMAQLTVIGYLIIALLGAAVESALYAGSGAFAPGVAAAATILVADRLMSLLIQHAERARRFFVGSPIVLVHDGQIVREHLRQSRLTRQNLMTAVRIRGYDDLNEVKSAILEVDGTISVIANN